MSVTKALHRVGGVADRATLLRAVTARELRLAVALGEVLHPRRDVYTLPITDEAVLAARQVSGVVSHLSAALACGWKVKWVPQQPTVTVRRNHHGASTKALLKYADLSAAEVTQGRTSPARTVVDCARTLPFDEALCVADSALRSRSVTRAELLQAVESGPRVGRARARRVVREATGKSANPFESVLRAIARDVPGLSVVPQCPVGLVGHADIGDPVLRIAAEAESWEYHGLRDAFEYDIRRYTAMVRGGWLVVRFTWDDVMHKPDYVRAVLSDLVALRRRQQLAG
jgi:very-short-patch-repair endonuclease